MDSYGGKGAARRRVVRHWLVLACCCQLGWSPGVSCLPPHAAPAPTRACSSCITDCAAFASKPSADIKLTSPPQSVAGHTACTVAQIARCRLRCLAFFFSTSTNLQACALSPDTGKPATMQACTQMCAGA